MLNVRDPPEVDKVARIFYDFFLRYQSDGQCQIVNRLDRGDKDIINYIRQFPVEYLNRVRDYMQQQVDLKIVYGDEHESSVDAKNFMTAVDHFGQLFLTPQTNLRKTG